MCAQQLHQPLALCLGRKVCPAAPPGHRLRGLKGQRRGARPATPPAIRCRKHLGWAMVGPPLRGPSAPCLLLNCRRQHWELYTAAPSSSAIVLAALVTLEGPAPSSTAHCGARLPCTGSSIYKGAKLPRSLAAKEFGLGLGGPRCPRAAGLGGQDAQASQQEARRRERSIAVAAAAQEPR